MSSHHESGFFRKRVLDKPSASGPESTNSIFIPVVVQPKRPVEPGHTPTPETDRPTATAVRPSPTATDRPTQEPSPTSTETPEPTETPRSKEVLFISKDVRAYGADMPADPYSPSKRLGKLAGIDLEQIRIEVDPNDQDTGWIITTNGVAVAYRFAYSSYGSVAGQEPAGPQQEPIMVEIRLKDLQTLGLIDKLPPPNEQVYKGPRIIRKVIARGAGLTSKIKTRAQAEVDPLRSAALETTNLTTLAIGAGISQLAENPFLNRRKFILGLAAGAGTLLAPRLFQGGNEESVSARTQASAVPVGEIPLSSGLNEVAIVDPAFEVPQDGVIAVRAVIDSPEFTYAVVNRVDSLAEKATGVLLARTADGALYVEVREKESSQKFQISFPDYKPEDSQLTDFEIKLGSDKQSITLTIFDQNGSHAIVFRSNDRLDAQALNIFSQSLDPKKTHIYTDVSFDADPQRIVDAQEIEAQKRLKELDVLNHRTLAIQPSADLDLWTSSLGITGLIGTDTKYFASDWYRSGAEIDGATDIFFDPYVDHPDIKEAAWYLANVKNKTPFSISIFGFPEIDALLAANETSLLRTVELSSIPAEKKGDDVIEYLRALQAGRTPDSKIRLAFRDFFDATTGKLSKNMLKVGNAQVLPGILAQTSPDGAPFNHNIILGRNTPLTEAYVNQLAITIGSLIKAGLPLDTIIASSTPPDGVSLDDHLNGRTRLVQAMDSLGVSVGSDSVQDGGLPFTDEVRLNAIDGTPAPTILVHASRGSSDDTTRNPYSFTTGGGLVLNEANYRLLAR